MSELQEFGSQPAKPEESHGTDVTSAGKPAPKTIVVCCDGTGNEFAGEDAKNSNSNVVKLYTALKLDFTQIAYYHPGVGTMGDPTKKGIARGWSMVKGLAFGLGFEENVLDAYRYLMQHYNAGDHVYIFGFSRGAYTARALAGLLHGYGLLCRGNEGHIPYAWRMYTQALVTQQNRRTIPTDFTFRDTFSHPKFMIDFVGLWGHRLVRRLDHDAPCACCIWRKTQRSSRAVTRSASTSGAASTRTISGAMRSTCSIHRPSSARSRLSGQTGPKSRTCCRCGSPAFTRTLEEAIRSWRASCRTSRCAG